MNKQFQKLAAIAATILIITTLSACNRASDNNENNDNSELNEIELLTIEELAPLNTKVKNGETTPEETIEIYKKMITRNLKDEGKDILGKAMISETFTVLQEQLKNELETNFDNGVKLTRETLRWNSGALDLADHFYIKLGEQAEKLLEEGNYQKAQDVINVRFSYGFDMDHMDTKFRILIKLAEQQLAEPNKETAAESIKELTLTADIESNSSLMEKYGEKIEELHAQLLNLN